MATKKKIIRNLDAVIDSRYSKALVKGIECTAKWLATDHLGCNDLASMMELQQNLYFDNALINNY